MNEDDGVMIFEIGDECPNCGAILIMDEVVTGSCFSCGCDLTNPEEWEDEYDDGRIWIYE